MPYDYGDEELNSIHEMLVDIAAENGKQLAKWGVQYHTAPMWLTILTKEVGELAKAIWELEVTGTENRITENRLRGNVYAEAIQVATLSLKIAEMIGIVKGEKDGTERDKTQT